MAKWMGAALVALLVFGGCSWTAPVTENHKVLNAMNRDAGDQLSKSDVPAIAQVGADVRDNSNVLAKTVIGEPQTPVKYSAQLSAQIRASALKEFEANQPWYRKFAGSLLGGAGVLLTVVGFAARFYPPAGVIASIAQPILTSLMNIKQQADDHPNDVIPLDSVQAEINTLMTNPKVGPLVTKLLKDAHLQQAITSPDAPTPHVDSPNQATPTPTPPSSPAA